MRNGISQNEEVKTENFCIFVISKVKMETKENFLIEKKDFKEKKKTNLEEGQTVLEDFRETVMGTRRVLKVVERLNSKNFKTVKVNIEENLFSVLFEVGVANNVILFNVVLIKVLKRNLLWNEGIDFKVWNVTFLDLNYLGSPVKLVRICLALIKNKESEKNLEVVRKLKVVIEINIEVFLTAIEDFQEGIVLLVNLENKTFLGIRKVEQNLLKVLKVEKVFLNILIQDIRKGPKQVKGSTLIFAIKDKG